MCPRPSNGRNSSLFPQYLPAWHSWLCRCCLPQSNVLRGAWSPGDTSTGPQRLEAAEPAQHWLCQRSPTASHTERWFSVTSAQPALPATQHGRDKGPTSPARSCFLPRPPSGSVIRACLQRKD